MSNISRLLLCLCVFSAAVFAQQPDASHETPDAENTSVQARDGGALVPHFVRFSGVVKDDAGNPRTGVVGLTFGLYDQNNGGAAIWQETQNVTLDDAGRYNVLLGATTLRGLPMAPFVSGEARFIGVRVLEEGAVEQQRVRLVSVPYALTAGDARSLGGHPVTDFALTKAAAAASGDAQAAGLPTEVSGAVSSAANTVNLLAKFTALDTVGDSQIFDNGTNVGIGTVSPGTKLDVAGSVNSAGYSIGGGLFALSNNNQTKIFSGTAGTVIYDNTGGTQYGNFSATGLNVTGNLQAATFNATTGFSLGGSLFAISNNNQTKFFSGTAGTVVYDNTGGIALGNFTPSGLFVTGSLNATTTVNATTGYNLGGNLFALFAGNQTRFYSGSGGTVIYDNTGAIPIGTFTAAGLAVTGALNSSGTIRSSSGGFIFPDNSTQTSAIPGNCANTQIPKWNGTAWACAADAGGAGGGPAVFTGTNATQIVYATQGGSTAVAPSVVAPPPSAIRGDATAPTLATPNYAVGVLGSAVSKDGYGVLGVNTAATGDAFGIVGLSSASPDGTGIIGESDAATGLTTGVWGLSASTTGTGVYAQASSTSGEAWGVWGITNSAAGYGGVFSNNANGNIIQGTNATTRVFRLDGTGKGFFNGSTQVGGADFAESVAVLGSPSTYQPGDVMVIDKENDRQIVLSSTKYARNVAGVYSTKPGVVATHHTMEDPRITDSEIPLAIVGIVPCKVTDEGGAIARGDLLVTSSTPGYAMKGTDNKKMLGAIIGKAMQPLKSGKRTIEILITLQ